MKKYKCPFCLVQLNLNGQLILLSHFKSGQKGLVLLSEKIGDYSVYISDDIKIERGEKAQFLCPSCHKSLEYYKNRNLVRIIKENELGRDFTIIFSAIFGEHCTYKITEERTLTYGETAMRYQNPEWYLQQK